MESKQAVLRRNQVIFRKVMRVNYVGASRYTGYRNRTAKLKLECGHLRYQKASQFVGERARCRDCEENRPVLDEFNRIAENA
jgi:hypothetical protein